jgi:hypothetical protein
MWHGFAAGCRSALGIAVLGAALTPAAAQRGAEPSRPTWSAVYPSKYWESTTAGERTAIMATLGEIERILWQVPELAQPKGFEVMKTAHGGWPPWHPERRPSGFEDAKSILESEFRLWFFAPSKAIAGEGYTCINVLVNRPHIGHEDLESSRPVDEAGRIIIVEPPIGDPIIPGATILHEGLRWDTPTADRRSAFVTFSSRGTFPWKPVTREQFLRWWIYHAEGADYGGNERSARKSLEKTTYERWTEEAAKRKRDRDDAIAIALQVQGRAAAEELRKTLEQTEREITERLQTEDAEERKRNQAILGAPSQGDQFRARIAAMSPAERASPAIAPYNSTEFVAPDDPEAHRVLTPDPEFWRVRRSRAEVHSITVVFHAHLTCHHPAVRAALEKAYQTLDWAAFKRIVDRPW